MYTAAANQKHLRDSAVSMPRMLSAGHHRAPACRQRCRGGCCSPLGSFEALCASGIVACMLGMYGVAPEPLHKGRGWGSARESTLRCVLHTSTANWSAFSVAGVHLFPSLAFACSLHAHAKPWSRRGVEDAYVFRTPECKKRRKRSIASRQPSYTSPRRAT